MHSNKHTAAQHACKGTHKHSSKDTNPIKSAVFSNFGYRIDVFHVVFSDADECDMDEDMLRRLLRSSGTMDAARGLISRDA